MGVEVQKFGNSEEHEDHWGKAVVPQVLHLVSAYLSQRDLCALLCVSASCHKQLTSHAPLWKLLDLHGKNNGGEILVATMALKRYQNVEEINLEFAQGVEDKHLTSIASKGLQRLNLNACQKITDSGVIFIASANMNLRSFSIYWNLKVTDVAVEAIVRSCKNLTNLNISGCKNITDKSLYNVAKYLPHIQSLNLTRGVKLTDDGLVELTNACQDLEVLYLYAVPKKGETDCQEEEGQSGEGIGGLEGTSYPAYIGETKGDTSTEAAPLLLEVTTKLVEDAPLPLATGSNVKLLDLDEENKAKANVVARRFVVSLAGGTLHGPVIEEGNVSVCVSSIEPGAESMLLYKGNDDDDPLMVHLGDALKSITKWPMEVLHAVPEEPQQAI